MKSELIWSKSLVISRKAIDCEALIPLETLKYKWPRSLLKKMIDDYKDIPKERLPKDFGPSLGSGVNVDIPLRKYRKKKLSPMIRRKKRKTIEQEAAKGGLAKVLGV